MLESAIKYASDSECTSERVSSLQKHATFTLNLRKNVINRNFAILQSELEGIQNNIGEDCIIYDEVDSAKAYLDNFTFKSKVEEALSATEIIGAVGDIILPKEYQDLAQTLSFGKNIFDKLTNSNKSLLEISTIIYDIRFAAISNQWEDVEVLVKQQIMNNSLQKYKQELELLAGESKNRKVVIRLSDALTQDMPTGTLEQADLSSTTTRYLKEAIDFARSHDSLTSAAKLLLSSASIMDSDLVIET